ncbi:relaxase/mobilization nuclease domain-containing protein [Chitinophaga sp. GCM10012297]|uniref:Relaxase/mobilization nuclease domain-containing protein n=1 Tax=Chitinophaga chungangae TaxID=2821488 RepID=A0ABS3YJ14_9BACT|nr:relaxase/mobilization nuclease domain-containing protein [Chitinophaga chungangae]MBO9154665.1 relaxase/mobilization nuclease domain-containing protein [Chitinophaga chungangae]
MISKVISSASFRRICQYVLGKDGAYVLAADGIRDHCPRLMADDFEAQAELRRTISRPCFHAVLSFPPGEKVTDELMEELAGKYLEKIGMVDTQFAVICHTDTEHPHVHIIANRVNFQGKAISDSMIGRRAKAAAQELTRDFGLRPAEKKDISRIQIKAMSEPEQIRYRIYSAITSSLKGCPDLDELTRRLKVRGVETVVKFRSGTREPQGISFKVRDFCFKGSAVDRRFSLANLQRAMASKQRISQDSGNSPRLIPLQQSSSGFSFVKEVPMKEVASVMTGILEELFKPEYVNNQIPYELLQEARKKKRRSGLSR